jgi:glycosyltransferase involved in cell wall biosynthesis
MIPNGVDTNRFRPNHVLRSSLRAELGIADEAPVVSIIAALRPEKNHVQFVEAARTILQQQPLTKFLIVGEGPERTTIVKRIEQLGLQAQFHLLGNRSDTERILAGTDLFCLTSRNEANPVSILEALATCLPVVAPDVGSIKETVLPGKTGLLTQPLSSAATAEAIVQLLGNASLAARMGRTGRQLVRDQWSLQAMVQGYETLIEELYNAKAEVVGRPLWHKPLQDLPSLEQEISQPRALVLQ